jgi:protein-L-isoaspartate O-methyltransferase
MTTSLHNSYDAHPLNAVAIMARLARDGREAPTELDLALDPDTFVTDQNHVGGLATVIQLAEEARVTCRSRVCDIGGGLGGSARSLAQLFGCHVHLVDIHHARCRDARTLNHLVGLTQLVSVECADAAVSRSSERFDVLWGQSAWIHFERLAAVLQLWSSALTSDGRAACEDAFVKRPAHRDEEGDVRELEQIWNCRFSDLAQWQHQFEQGGFTVAAFHDLTCLLEPHFTQMLGSGQQPDETERHGWVLALSLTRRGLLGYGRWLARLRNA